VEGDQVGQVGPAFHEPMLTGPDLLVVLHMPGERTQDESLHNLAQHRGQTDRSVVPRILLLDGHHTVDPPVTWDLPWSPGLLIGDGEGLGQPLHQLLQYSWVDPIWHHRLVNVQVAQQVVNCFLLDYGRFILLSIPDFQHWGLNTVGITGLTVKDRGEESRK